MISHPKQALVLYMHTTSPSQASNAKFGKVLRVTLPLESFEISYIIYNQRWGRCLPSNIGLMSMYIKL